MKHQFITAHRTDYPVRCLCHALQVSASGYYAACGRRVSARSQRQTALTARIEAIHVASRATYGAPRIHAELRAKAKLVA